MNEQEQSLTLTVTGMTCGGCAGRVSTAARGVPGVVRAEVDPTAGLLHVTGSASADAVAAAVADAGYGIG
jgi:Cu+-exporting ATPase